MFEIQLQQSRGCRLRYGVKQEETAAIVTSLDRCASGKEKLGQLLPGSTECIIQRRPFVYVPCVDIRSRRNEPPGHRQAVPANLRICPLGSDFGRGDK